MGVNHVLFIVVFIFALLWFGLLVAEKWSYVMLGQPLDRSQNPGQRWKGVGVFVFGQRRLFKDKYSGPMHFTIFWGFIVLTVGSIIFLIREVGECPTVQLVPVTVVAAGLGIAHVDAHGQTGQQLRISILRCDESAEAGRLLGVPVENLIQQLGPVWVNLPDQIRAGRRVRRPVGTPHRVREVHPSPSV